MTTLTSSGFTEIELRGLANPFACGQDDLYRMNFKAKNAMGSVVEGVVCCGLAKSCTVRF